MITTIKDCPFCGQVMNTYTNPFWEEDYMVAGTFYAVMCKNCECKGPECSDKQEAVKKWNQRTIN